MPLKERLEAASRDFATTCVPKVRQARGGVRFYSSDEFIRDVRSVAGEHGLFPEAVWAYCGRLLDEDFARLSRSVR
jgi:hypothetical protein